jgi:hypothetical protein
MLKCYECDIEFEDNIKAVDGHVFCSDECKNYYATMCHMAIRLLKYPKNR